jgi:hypothetical protein
MAELVMMELVRQFLHRKPFVPFRVVLKSGTRVEIGDPEKVAIGGTKAFVFLPPLDRMTELPEADIELVYVPRRRC